MQTIRYVRLNGIHVDKSTSTLNGIVFYNTAKQKIIGEQTLEFIAKEGNDVPVL